ncbi:MAG: hypothetical protein V4722_28790 [Bacteroidota bacterium]
MKQLFYIGILILTPYLGASQSIKQEASEFFKSIVKTCFDLDCDRFYSFFTDSAAIISPNGVGVYSTKKMIESKKACDKFEEFTEGLSSFQDYLNHYKIVILNKKEFTSKNNDTIIKKISAEKTDNLFVYEILQEFNNNFTNSDYLVFGNIQKSNEKRVAGDGFFWMVVRKTKQGWKIYGTRA